MTLFRNFFILFVLSLAVACVPAKQLENAKAEQKKCEQQLAELKASSLESNSKILDIQEEAERLRRRNINLQNDTAVMGTSLRLMAENYDKLNETYELLLDKNQELISNSTEENKRIISDLQNAQNKLQVEQDALRVLKADLDEKKKSLERLEGDLVKTTAELKQREEKVRELERVLHAKDSTVNALKKSVSDALTGFENNGLTIEKKNGKVYVSLEERLLFATGSIVVDPKGVEALKQLSEMLQSNPDINILIEGHTDNVPYNGSAGAIKDNWDLSVLRATSIVKILTREGKVDPKRLIASGRGEYWPLDAQNNAEARKRNRRTEIILTPKLDEVLKILENN